jgi:predicted CXXCH cytochrome family protein
MRRLALLLPGLAVWLLLAAVPALADGGPHVASATSGISTLTSDSCAGCHRAHTAQGQYLNRAASVEALCLTCHGAAGTGASADVMTGVQYAVGASSGLRDDSVVIGALRNGGFDQSRINSSSPARITYLRTATDPSFRAKVSAGAPADVTSAHLAMPENGLIGKGVAWGNGAAGSGAGPKVDLECTSCHNPHGNGQYRILNTLPTAAGNGFADPVAVPVSGVSATTDRFTTSQAHGFVVGDIVTISGVSGAAPAFGTAAQYIVKSIPNGVTFTVAAAPTKTSIDITGAAIDITASGSGGTVSRYAVRVDDAPLPAAGDERNYAILQTRGYQGAPGSYLLYASDVLSARASGAFDISADIVGLTASNGRFTTSLAHGFAIGDSVTIAGVSSPNPGVNGVRTIASIPSATTFTLTGITVANQTAGTAAGDRLGTATKSVAGDFASTSGDYLHRTVPWNPRAVNAACPETAPVDSAANPELASACLTANDAPNGRPATVAATSTVNGTTITPAAYGQVAFNDQISAWCSACHTRYYSSTNPNPGTESGSAAEVARTVSAVNTGTDTITLSGTLPGGGAITSTGFSVGDVVKFTATPTAPDLSSGTWYVVYASSLTFRVSATYDGPPVDISAYSGGGTVIRLYPASASSWFYPRPGDDTYTFQHQTTTNRACTTCHVSHGSPAVMSGTYSAGVLYPDGSAATSGNSRLLKLDNRGTCQMCHDPSGTTTAGQLLPATLASPPPVP